MPPNVSRPCSTSSAARWPRNDSASRSRLNTCAGRPPPRWRPRTPTRRRPGPHRPAPKPGNRQPNTPPPKPVHRGIVARRTRRSPPPAPRRTRHAPSRKPGRTRPSAHRAPRTTRRPRDTRPAPVATGCCQRAEVIGVLPFSGQLHPTAGPMVVLAPVGAWPPLCGCTAAGATCTAARPPSPAPTGAPITYGVPGRGEHHLPRVRAALMAGIRCWCPPAVPIWRVATPHAGPGRCARCEWVGLVPGGEPGVCVATARPRGNTPGSVAS